MVRRSGPTKGKTKEIKFRVDQDVLDAIDEQQVSAGYGTRAAYLTAAALSGVETDRSTIARHIGGLGHLSNALLAAVSSERNAEVEGDIRRIVGQISDACLLLTNSLRERD